ncbi:MAG: DUF1638 domain-containing protein [Planctomycetes bacterium]|nr:DUF1638 domain-containing protein [Planctomycetota bacterium]
MSKVKLLACEVMREEIEFILAKASRADQFDIEWFEMGLHERPEKLRLELEKRVHAASRDKFDTILLLFGLCSNATAGLVAPAGVTIIIPRVHDCVSLYLGSAKTYQQEMTKEAGTYWFSRGFLHRSDGRSPELSGLGAGGSLVGNEDGTYMSVAEMRDQFVEQYGEENADYLIETLVESWKKNYRRAVFIDWGDSSTGEQDRRYVEQYAKDNNWVYETRPFAPRLLEALLFGDWPEDEFVVLKPGQRLIATHDARALAVGTA